MRFISAIGWFLLSLGGVFAILSVLVLFDEKPDRSALLGMMMLTAMTAAPGGMIVWRTSLRRRERTFQTEFAGLLRTHDRFTVAEMAKKIGRTELETEQLIARAVEEAGLELVFHRSTREYLHRNRVKESHRVVDRCGSCGAALNHELVLEGEPTACQYCGSVLVG